MDLRDPVASFSGGLTVVILEREREREAEGEEDSEFLSP